MRGCRALFGGLLLLVEPWCAVTPFVASRARERSACGRRCDRVRVRRLVGKLRLASRVANLRESTVGVCLWRSCWRDAALGKVLKWIGSRRANGRGILACDEAGFPHVLFCCAVGAGYFVPCLGGAGQGA